MSKIFNGATKLVYYECIDGCVERIGSEHTVVDVLNQCPICGAALEVKTTYETELVPTMLNPENKTFGGQK